MARLRLTALVIAAPVPLLLGVTGWLLLTANQGTVPLSTISTTVWGL